jgi:hypothetical protein
LIGSVKQVQRGEQIVGNQAGSRVVGDPGVGQKR